MTEISPYVMATKPDSNGQPSLPRRAPKGLLPSTWVDRSLKLHYMDGNGSAKEDSGVLLELFPAGPVLLIQGAKRLVCWERIAWLELIEDAG